MKTLKIGKNKIGLSQQVYIIAEAGVNHNGSIDTALSLIDNAKDIGADCVKFQTFKAEKVVTKSAAKANYQTKVTDANESQYDMLKKLELGYEEFESLILRCKEIGIQFMSTPYNMEDALMLNQLGVDSFKIGSGQLVETSFLRYVASFGKPMIISTGMAKLSEVYDAVECIRAEGNDQIIVLQCTTNYPSKIEDSNVRAMNSMEESLDVLVGYSDHVPNNYACYAAVARGACVIEKHYTLDKSMSGPDHSSSLDPREFKELVHGIRNIEASLGSAVKRPSEEEKENTYGMRRSIVVNRKLLAGHVLTEDDIDYKRPMAGISPKDFDLVLGKKLAFNMEEDELLMYNKIVW